MTRILLLLSALIFTMFASARMFTVGEDDFLLDGKPLKIHCGEIHYARIPRAYWWHRLQMLKAMGCNAVGCYMFWNYHEREPGVFTWEGRADAASFCQMAQEEGFWVILRPGPYACAEWEGGGAPWWLLKEDGIAMRSSDSRWVEPCKRWIAEVGRQLAPLQVTKGGPILMVQVENEYGLHGSDTAYIRTLREATLAAGFEVPLYACNPPRVMENGYIPELFQAANFGADPEQRFSLLRQFQPKGPLMCSEYYPAWFDTWGQAHHPPKRDRDFFGPIDWMLKHGASFSLYMAHGGTSFGGWTGCRNPFVPNVTSYDYEAPINEQGAANPSFYKLRARLHGTAEIPAPIPVAAYGTVKLSPCEAERAEAAREVKLDEPRFMEALGQGFGLVSYERDLAADESGLLEVGELHDFGYVFLDGERLGTLDRRHRGVKVSVPAGGDARRLRILVEAMGRINSSQGMEDRKGLNGPVFLGGKRLKGWTAKLMPIDPDRSSQGQLAVLPNTWAGVLNVDTPADTFLDLRGWTKGIVWVNGHNLGRFWNIGPQQTLYLPGCWLKPGPNEVVVLDFFGPRGAPEIVSVERPILDELHPELDFNRVSRETTAFVGGVAVAEGAFANTEEAKVVMFDQPVCGRRFTLQILSSYDKKNLAAIGEFDLLDSAGNPLASAGLTVTGVSSEEEIREDGVAENAIDGQVEAFWVTSSRNLPHWIEFTASEETEVAGFRLTPKLGAALGRIKDWKFFRR